MKILFICTHNRCRSIIAEAITNHISGTTIQAASAGSSPVGEVHPLSLKYLAEAGIATQGLHSQSWHDLESFEPDVVVTVCDSAANETCPIWFGKALKVHWGLADPSKVEGTEEQVKAAFISLMHTLLNRIEFLLAQPLETLSTQQLSDLFTQIEKA